MPNLYPQRTIFLDTETTGLNRADDDVLELSVINDAGDVLLDTLVQPMFKTSWEDAQRIHGITPDDVKDAPT